VVGSQLGQLREPDACPGCDREVGYIVVTDLGQAARRQHHIEMLRHTSQSNFGATPPQQYRQLLALRPLQHGCYLLDGLRKHHGAGDAAIHGIAL
jgi:hypothetical protein